MNQTQHDSNAASVYNQELIESGNLMQPNPIQTKASAENPELAGRLRSLPLSKFDKL